MDVVFQCKQKRYTVYYCKTDVISVIILVQILSDLAKMESDHLQSMPNKSWPMDIH